jgi:FeS assembly SUF system protein
MAEQTVTKERVIQALKNVYDPEIPINVVDLGLIYDVQVEEGRVHIQMTLTSPGCGLAPFIAKQAEWAVSELEGVEDVQVELVWDPPWTPERISSDGRKLLGLE